MCSWPLTGRSRSNVADHQVVFGVTNTPIQKNLADSGDTLVGKAAAFKLKWFGGVGPSRMPDRHLRGPAPLSAGGAMVVQGDGVLIGVDPANGTERWQFPLPEKAMRYVTPYDAGYVCLDETGDRLTLAAGDDLVTLNALFRIPAGQSFNRTIGSKVGICFSRPDDNHCYLDEADSLANGDRSQDPTDFRRSGLSFGTTTGL